MFDQGVHWMWIHVMTMATLSSVEYNRPIIQGPKTTSKECHATYKRFFEDRIQHLDHVCYREVVFSNILAIWCQLWNVTIDVNQFSESHNEILLMLKLQYRPTRWVRLVEAMAITHFITGAHKCLINEYSNTRVGPFERLWGGKGWMPQSWLRRMRFCKKKLRKWKLMNWSELRMRLTWVDLHRSCWDRELLRD